MDDNIGVFGSIEIVPSLNTKEINYLKNFTTSRRMDREKGSYYANAGKNHGQTHAPDIIDYNSPPIEQPTLWCNWTINDSGNALIWNPMGEYNYLAEWLIYLKKHFLNEIPLAKVVDQKFNFLQEHTLNGNVFVRGNDNDDISKLVIEKNEIHRYNGGYHYPFNRKRMGDDLWSEAMMNHHIMWENVKWSKDFTPYKVTYTDHQKALIEKYKIEQERLQQKETKKLKIL